MSALEISVPEVFRPLWQPARYKGAHGGRGSGKSHHFAEKLVIECLRQPGTRAVCIREVQKSIAESSKRLIEAKIQELGVGRQFETLEKFTRTPGGGMILYQGLQDHTAESIKSLEGCRIAWIEEAQAVSKRSFEMLRPTIRLEGSEIWASWNPRRKTDAVDEFFRDKKPENAIAVQANWRDNPFFPDVLEKERLMDLDLYPDRYEHIWEGDYARAFEGAYFARVLAEAKSERRIGPVARDPMLPVRAFFDLGGSGASADAMAIWLVQFVGQSIRVLDYIEGQGQVLAFYVEALRERGVKPKTDELILPHDGMHSNAITGKRYEDHLRDAGFDNVRSIANQGKGAAMQRIEAVRRVFNRCWFDAEKCEAGLDALGYYHERKDENRNVGLGPEHDWSSHAADAFGLMAIVYEEPSMPTRRKAYEVAPDRGSKSWKVA